MAVDTSIYSMIQPVKPVADPMQQHAQMMQIGHMMDSGALNQLQRKKLEGDLAEEEKLKQLFAGGRTPTVQEVYGVSPSRGATYQKSQLETRAAQANIQKTNLESLNKSLSLHRELLAGVNTPQDAARWAMAGFNDPVLSPLLQRAGGPSEYIARIPQDPEAFQRWKMENGSSMEKLLELTAPKVQPVSAGGETVFRDTNPRSAGFNANAPIAHTQTPDSAASNATTRRGQDFTKATAKRGQDMTDRRERDIPLAAAQAAARETGKATAEAQMSLPAVVAQAERGVRLIDELVGSEDGKTKQHPGFQAAVGVGIGKTLSPFWAPPGTDRRDFEARLDEIKGGAFMQAFQNLKGGGQITEIEGKKATQAITRMETAQSEREFVKAAREFQQVVKTGLDAAKKKASTNLGGVLKQNPDGSFSYGFGR